jgi:tetratricopeptide (TPR) repeat protein
MSSFLSSLVRLSSVAAEGGLSLVDSSLELAQKTTRQAFGHPGTRPRRAPLEGPEDVDAATSELANRLLRSALHARLTPRGVGEISREVVEAIEQSFRLRGADRWLALPFELPLSLASLGLRQAQLGMVAAQAVPEGGRGDFVGFITELFSDLHVYFSLQYRHEIDRWRERVRRHPGDARARLELGRTLLKCGLYREAIEELARVDSDSKLRRRALYHSLVAGCRGGLYADAIEDGIACLEIEPGDELARYWLWLAAVQSGGYPESVAPALRLEPRDGYHPTAVELEEVAAEIGLDKTSGGRGTAVADLDGNGYLDVVIAGAHAGVSLYHNNGDGTFTDISAGSGLDACVYGFGVAAADYDNNGLTDLFVTSMGFFNGESALYRNNGDGTFTDVTREAGVECWGPAFTASWVDTNGDGLLDLFVANNLGGLFDRKTPNRLFRNNGDGTFTDVTREAGLLTRWATIGAAWGDFDNNGLPDLFLSGLGRAQLFRNQGDGTFRDVSRSAGIDRPAIGSVATVWDIDDDGWLDILQFTYSRPAEAIHTLRHGRGPSDGEPLRVFRNNRDGTFTEVADRLGITGCWGTMTANLGDFDNDGHADILLGNGDPSMDRCEAPVLLANNGAGRFANVSFAAGLPFTGKGHGANLADLAGDGRLHLIMANGGLYPGDLLTTTVHRPRALPGSYLNVRLVGTTGNRDAIGARLALAAGGRVQRRLVSGGSGFGCLPLEQHFGLGESAAVDSLEIRWPGGAVERRDDLPVDTTVRIVEGEPGWRPVYPDKR